MNFRAAALHCKTLWFWALMFLLPLSWGAESSGVSACGPPGGAAAFLRAAAAASSVEETLLPGAPR